MAESSDNATAAPVPAPPAAPAPATVLSPAPKMSPPANSGIPSRYDLHAKWDACLDLSIHRVAYSSLAGAFGGLILFRKLPPPPPPPSHSRPISPENLLPPIESEGSLLPLLKFGWTELDPWVDALLLIVNCCSFI
ncbi:hypothetical protein D1007_21733 [Hordeum vulgare]|nr:hypothetical protein D1007_21733 [Hordeum vulgare]